MVKVAVSKLETNMKRSQRKILDFDGPGMNVSGKQKSISEQEL